MSKTAPIIDLTGEEDESCQELTSLIATMFPEVKKNLGKPKHCPDISSVHNYLAESGFPSEYIPVAIDTNGNCFFHALTVWYRVIQQQELDTNLRESVVNKFKLAITNPAILNELVEKYALTPDLKTISKHLRNKSYDNDTIDVLINIIGEPEYDLLPKINGVTPRVCMYSKSALGLVSFCSPPGLLDNRQQTVVLYRSGDHFSLLLTKDQADMLRDEYALMEAEGGYYGGKRHHTRKRRNHRLYRKTARKGNKQTKKQKSSIRKLALKTLKKESIQNIKKTVCSIFNSKQQKKCKASFDKSYIKSFMQAKKMSV